MWIAKPVEGTFDMLKNSIIITLDDLTINQSRGV